MSRIKPLVITAAVVVAVISFVRTRLSEGPAVDAGGWEPVDPS